MVDKKAFLLFFTMIALLVGAFIFSLQEPGKQKLHEGLEQSDTALVEHGATEDLYTVYVDTVPFEVSLAGSMQDRTRGLSGVTTLPEGEGKLFVFEESDTYGFWMKDMHFSIDILWFTKDGTLVHVAHSVTPESYPELFVPPKAALYVLELNAGDSKANGFGIDSTLTLGENLLSCLQETCFLE